MAIEPPRLPLAAFPDLRPVRPKTPLRGRGLRRRWKDAEGLILEWDYQHGAFEVYDARGKHLGQFDPITGEQSKPPDPTRHIEP
jgi:hypothetical protein